MSKTITGVVTWLRNWFYTKTEVDNALILINPSGSNWTVLSNSETYTDSKTSQLTTDAWTGHGQGGSVSDTSINLRQGSGVVYTNLTEKKVRLILTLVSGAIDIGDSDSLSEAGSSVTYYLNSGETLEIYSDGVSVFDYVVGTQTNIISSIINVAYPVGSVYISSGTMHPSVVFGGSWEHFAEDKFLLSAGSTYGYNTSGGSADAVVVKHNHTQNAHYHNANSDGTRSFMTAPTGSNWNEIAGSNISGSGYHYVVTQDKSNYNVWVNQSANATATNKESGVDGTGKNMPPYLAVYMWKRTG